jgi:hypothetical protein
MAQKISILILFSSKIEISKYQDCIFSAFMEFNTSKTARNQVFQIISHSKEIPACSTRLGLVDFTFIDIASHLGIQHTNQFSRVSEISVDSQT